MSNSFKFESFTPKEKSEFCKILASRVKENCRFPDNSSMQNIEPEISSQIEAILEGNYKAGAVIDLNISCQHNNMIYCNHDNENPNLDCFGSMFGAGQILLDIGGKIFKVMLNVKKNSPSWSQMNSVKHTDIISPKQHQTNQKPKKKSGKKRIYIPSQTN